MGTSYLDWSTKKGYSPAAAKNAENVVTKRIIGHLDEIVFTSLSGCGRLTKAPVALPIRPGNQASSSEARSTVRRCVSGLRHLAKRR